MGGTDVGKGGRKPTTSRTAKNAQKNAKRRGDRFEERVAERTPNSLVWTRQDGDVHIWDLDIRIECKYRSGLTLDSSTGFRDFLEQVNRYRTEHWRPGQRWALALTGGKPYRGPAKSGIYVTISHEEYVRLLELDRRFGGAVPLEADAGSDD